MNARPSLVRSIPYWILLVGSLATSAAGAWLTIDRLGSMSAVLTDGTATPVDVYVGQVWAIVGGILIATGILGLALVLVLGVLRSFVPVNEVELIEAIDWSAGDSESAETAPAPADAAETVPAEPVAASEESHTDAEAAAEAETAPQR